MEAIFEDSKHYNGHASLKLGFGSPYIQVRRCVAGGVPTFFDTFSHVFMDKAPR